LQLALNHFLDHHGWSFPLDEFCRERIALILSSFVEDPLEVFVKKSGKSAHK
jgi:hypothetical protein